jgi:hypothetical protein
VVAVIDQLPCSIATVNWAAARAAVDGPPLLVLLTQPRVRSPAMPLTPWPLAVPWHTDMAGERAEIFHEVAAQLAASGLPWDFQVIGEDEPFRPRHDTVIALPEHRRSHQWLSPRRRLLRHAATSPRLITVPCRRDGL